MTTPWPRTVPMPQVADAEAKQLQLDRMKRRATGLLVVMSAVFLAAASSTSTGTRSAPSSSIR